MAGVSNESERPVTFLSVSDVDPCPPASMNGSVDARIPSLRLIQQEALHVPLFGQQLSAMAAVFVQVEAAGAEDGFLRADAGLHPRDDGAFVAVAEFDIFPGAVPNLDRFAQDEPRVADNQPQNGNDGRHGESPVRVETVFSIIATASHSQYVFRVRPARTFTPGARFSAAHAVRHNRPALPVHGRENRWGKR